MTQRCASENCVGKPVWRFEVGGVGSVYCAFCRAQIESDQHWSDMDNAAKEMIRETITFSFENDQQRRAFMAVLRKRLSAKELVADWKDVAMELAVLTEREACANVADESAAKDRAMDKSYGGSRDDSGMSLRDCIITAEVIAADIRARGGK